MNEVCLKLWRYKIVEITHKRISRVPKSIKVEIYIFLLSSLCICTFTLFTLHFHLFSIHFRFVLSHELVEHVTCNFSCFQLIRTVWPLADKQESDVHTHTVVLDTRIKDNRHSCFIPHFHNFTWTVGWIKDKMYIKTA